MSIEQFQDYCHIEQFFPTDYPFQKISFEFDINRGYAQLNIETFSLLSKPLLSFLDRTFKPINFESARENGNPIPCINHILYGISVSFHLKGNTIVKAENPEKIRYKTQLFFSSIEKNILPGVRNVKNKQLFYQCKTNITKTVELYISNHKKGALSIANRKHKSPSKKLKRSYKKESDMRDALLKNDIQKIEQLLKSSHFEPHSLCSGDLKVYEVAHRHVNSYTISIKLGKPTKEELGKLSRKGGLFPPKNEKDKNFFKEQHYHPTQSLRVLIAYYNDSFYLYWTDNESILPKKIKETNSIEFLKSLLPNVKKTRRGFLSSINNQKDRLQIEEIIRPYFPIYERQRKDTAKTILAIHKLFVEYGWKIKRKKYSFSPTPIEMLINSAILSGESSDPVNRQLNIGLFKIFIEQDAGLSNLIVSSYYDNHYIAKLLFQWRQWKFNSSNHLHRPLIHSANTKTINQTPRIEIANNKAGTVYLTSMPIRFFVDNHPEKLKKVIKICEKNFPSFKLKSFIESQNIGTQLKANKTIKVIDLISDKNKKVIAFNLFEIKVPQNIDEPILYYIHLTAGNSSFRKAFPGLMSANTYGKIFVLKKLFHREVLFALATASVKGYRTLSGEFWPKYTKCVPTNYIKLIINTFLSDRRGEFKNGKYYMESDFYYHEPLREKPFLSESDINHLAYVDKYERKVKKHEKGYSMLIAAFSTARNMEAISKKNLKNFSTQMNLLRFSNAEIQLLFFALLLSAPSQKQLNDGSPNQQNYNLASLL